jgi:hypothetical protein
MPRRYCDGAPLRTDFDQDAIRRILTHLGLPTEPPTLAPPPEPLMPW